MRELFRQVSDPHPTVGSRRLSALPVSVLVHVLVLLAVVVIPLLATDVLPAVRVGDIEFRMVSLPQLPTPPPMRLAQRASPVPIAEAGGAPLEPPTGVQPELGIRSDPAPDVAAPGSGGVVNGDVTGGLDTGVVIDTAPAPAVVAPVGAHTLLRPPVRLHDAAPIYPEMARTARVQGVVIIEAVISTTGNVIEARILRSVALLDQAALDAVRQWKYTPSLLNGVPVPVVMTVTVTFTLK
jgi:periplasmic protein TonB